MSWYDIKLYIKCRIKLLIKSIALRAHLVAVGDAMQWFYARRVAGTSCFEIV